MTDLQQLVAAARKAGWSVRKRRGGHLVWQRPDGDGLIFSASTPSDWRSLANVRASLRRAGLIINGGQPHGER